MKLGRKKAVKGELVENRVVVWNIEDSRKLFANGFYGKPLGVSKPKGSDFTSPLILDLLEVYYLMGKGGLEIYRGDSGGKVRPKTVEKICRSEHINFEEKILVYTHLRESGFIVTPGIKFGCDFAVYEHGPGIDHAPYLVQVQKPEDGVTATSIVLAGRLATTVRKQFIVAEANIAKKRVEFLSFDWWRA